MYSQALMTVRIFAIIEVLNIILFFMLHCMFSV